MTFSTLKDRLAASTEIFGKETSNVDDFVLIYREAMLHGAQLDRVNEQLRCTRRLLEEALSLQFPNEVVIVICDGNGYLAERGLLGKAFRNTAFVQLDSTRFSHFAGTLTHELAHVLTQQLAGYAPPLLSEGIACYSAEVTDAAVRPMGMPLHFHLVWMLGVGLRPTLDELSERRDYSPEMYDLGWSLSTFLIETYGQEFFYDFYCSDAATPEGRSREVYGIASVKLERAWYEHARAAVMLDHHKIGRMNRGDGWTCSQAAWVSAN